MTAVPGWDQLLHRVLSRFVCVHNISIEAFDLASDPADLELSRVKVLLRTLLRVFSNHQHGRE